MALYLTYRPKDFNSIVGQNFVKETLQRAVTDNKTVGAYLLCGPRGTGKTTTARVLAKAVNCTQQTDGNPCNNCSSCDGINSESLIDVIEIDAASHTGVDNIREIIEKAQFQPTSAKYKIYIIDEVHMLSKGAFNALLKILEEPPSYVKFILATTETHKVPETIISRCQRYDMKSISLQDIKHRLEFIAKSENIEYDDASLEYIAKNSGGALRNAISLFEQLSSNSKIQYSTLVEQLGIVEGNILENFLGKLLSCDNSLLDDFKIIIEDGKNVKLFIRELLFYTKDISLEKISAGEKISQHMNILSVLDEAYAASKHSLDENMTFTIAFLKILSNYSSPVTPQVSQIQKVSSIKNTPKTPQVPLEKKEENTKSKIVTLDDIDDIFSENAVINPPESTSDSTNTLSDISEGSQDFNKELYINTLKKNGAKGAVTMSVRAANTQLTGEHLELQFKTKFALNSVNNTDTLGLLNAGLVSMGFSSHTVKLVS